MIGLSVYNKSYWNYKWIYINKNIPVIDAIYIYTINPYKYDNYISK